MRAPPAVLFDFDGTLVDSLPGLLRSVNRTLALLDRPPLDAGQVRRMVGEGAPALVERALLASGGVPSEGVGPHVSTMLAFYDDDARHHTSLFPGAREALEQLARSGYRLALCTNKPQGPTEVILDVLELTPLFHTVVGGDRLPVRKPHPDHLLETIRLAGGTAAQALLVGDSPADVLGARAAGIPVIAVRHGYTRAPPAELGADALVDRLADLPETVARLLPV